MDLHEYQAKNYLKKFQVPIPEYFVVTTEKEGKRIVEEEGLEEAVVKVQVHAGGRGKAGGVKFCRSKNEILQAIKEMLGMKIVTKQTGTEGLIAHKLLLTKPVDIAKEFYVAAVIDREKGSAMLVGSPEGGVEIEEVAKKTPEKIVSVPIQLDGSIRSYDLIDFNKVMGFSFKRGSQSIHLIQALAKAFVASDSSLLEINPLVQTSEGDLWAVDAKMSIDDNSLFRQPELADCFDPTQLPENEVRAHEHDLAYISMEGNIGCMVNGAGLAMATMDIIHYYGGKPANFLDVGGGASEEKVAEGFKLILSDPNVKGILVNIFGGIMNCATIAKGVIEAAKHLGIHVPLVVRLEGTNVESGKRMLEESNLDIIVADSLADGAEKVVQAI